MNTKWKIVVLVAVTLIIGIALGAVLDRAWVRAHRRESPDLRRAGLRLPDGPAADRTPGGFPGGPTPGSPGPGGPVPGGPGPGMPGPGGPGPNEFPLTRGHLAGQFGLAVMKAELKLSEDQAAKIKTIQAEIGKDVRWTPDSRNPPPGPDVMRKVERDMQEAVLKVLTKEQQEMFRRLLGPAGGGPRAPGPRSPKLP